MSIGVTWHKIRIVMKKGITYESINNYEGIREGQIMDFPVIHNPGCIEMLLSKIRETELPKVVDYDYLINLGFKREVDESLLQLLGFLGFIEENGQPTILWEKSLDPDEAPILLGKAVSVAYGILFKRFPNAATEESSSLMEFFRKNTSVSDSDVAYMILSFKVLCDLAELPEGSPAEHQPAPEKEITEPEKAHSIPSSYPVPVSGSAPAIRISINIDLDDKSDPELRSLALKLLKQQLETRS